MTKLLGLFDQKLPRGWLAAFRFAGLPWDDGNESASSLLIHELLLCLYGRQYRQGRTIVEFDTLTEYLDHWADTRGDRDDSSGG